MRRWPCGQLLKSVLEFYSHLQHRSRKMEARRKGFRKVKISPKSTRSIHTKITETVSVLFFQNNYFQQVFPVRRESRRCQTGSERTRSQEGQARHRRPPHTQGKGQEKAGRQTGGEFVHKAADQRYNCFSFVEHKEPYTAPLSAFLTSG